MNSNGDKSSRLVEVKSPDFVKGIAVYGHLIDHQTRCVHYHSSQDVIAIKFQMLRSLLPLLKLSRRKF